MATIGHIQPMPPLQCPKAFTVTFRHMLKLEEATFSFKKTLVITQDKEKHLQVTDVVSNVDPGPVDS